MLADVRLGAVERVAEYDVQLARQKDVFAVESAERKRRGWHRLYIYHDYAVRSPGTFARS